MTRTRTPQKTKSLTPLATIEEGRLSWDGSPFPKPCLVLTLSDDGAEIKLLSDLSLPAVVHLSVPGKKVTVRSKVARRQGAVIGLSFLDPPRPG